MKQINRRVMLKKRDRLSDKEIKEKSLAIKDKLFSSSEYKKASTVMFYVSFGSEVRTIEMIKESLKSKVVCVPVVEGDTITASVIEGILELDKKNVYEIKEPSKVKKINKEDIDMIIAPGIVFDRRNHRIGYGKAYYDNFLKGFKGIKIGLAFKMQVLEIIPSDEWDEQLDKVISE